MLSTECEKPPPKQAKTAVLTSLSEILEEVGATVSDSSRSRQVPVRALYSLPSI